MGSQEDELKKILMAYRSEHMHLTEKDGYVSDLPPRRGAIAICSIGRLGLITSDMPREITYNDGNKGTAWTGIQLTAGTVQGVGKDKGAVIHQVIGDGWSSRTPCVVGYLEPGLSAPFLQFFLYPMSQDRA